MLALKSKNLPTSEWERVLPDALHSIRSLICTSTNVTPHERLFNYQRRSTSGQSVPSWLSTPGPVLLKRHVRNSKYDPMVDEAELIEANPQYAHVRLCNGRETTVSLRDLAPYSPIVEPIVENEDTPPATIAPTGAASPSPTSDIANEEELGTRKVRVMMLGERLVLVL